MAIPISLGSDLITAAAGPRKNAFFPQLTQFFGFIGVAAMLAVPLRISAAQTNQILPLAGQPPADPATRAKRDYIETRARYQTNAEAAWQFGRACFDFSAFAADKSGRAEIAQEGIAACRKLLEAEPNSAPAHYYLGMNLGRLADTKRNLSGLRLVRDMEREFNAARELDEHFDFAGPDRNLGLLYEEAPAFISIGSRGKARQHLQRAVALAPYSPENRLDLIEAYLKWGDRTGALGELRALEEILPQARKKFSGDQWAANWVDWQKRIEIVKSKLEPRSE